MRDRYRKGGDQRMNFERRLNGLQRAMAAAGLDVVVYGTGPHLQYLTGLELDWRGPSDTSDDVSAIFVPAGGQAVLVLAERWSGRVDQTWIGNLRIVDGHADGGALAADVLGGFGGKTAAIAAGPRVASSVDDELKRSAGAAELRAAGPLLDRLRMIKDAEEVERLRAAADLAGRALAATVPRIVEGVLQREVQDELAYQGTLLGAAGVSFLPAALFIAAGAKPAGDPFTWPADEGLVAGTTIAFDFGFVKDGYCSDFGRSLYFGTPGREVRQGYAALHEAVLETVGLMSAGSMAIRELFPTVERVLDSLGYGDYLRARLGDGMLGHYIGIEVHEYPWLVPACEETLEADTVMALEPKLWHDGEYYLRVEDIVLVSETDAEILTSFDRDAFQL